MEMALVMPSGPLERYLRGVKWSLDAEDETRRHGRRSVTWRWDDDGSLVLTAHLSPEDGAVVVEALEATGARLRADQAGAPPLEELPDPDLGPRQDPQDVPAGPPSDCGVIKTRPFTLNSAQAGKAGRGSGHGWRCGRGCIDGCVCTECESGVPM